MGLPLSVCILNPCIHTSDVMSRYGHCNNCFGFGYDTQLKYTLSEDTI